MKFRNKREQDLWVAYVMKYAAAHDGARSRVSGDKFIMGLRERTPDEWPDESEKDPYR